MIMAATVQELIEYSLVNSAHINEAKARIIASRFDSIKTFLRAPSSTYKNLTYVGGKKVGLTDKNLEQIRTLQKSNMLNPKLTAQQNFIKILSVEFLNKQIGMIKGVKLKTLNANPILISSLKLNTPRSIVKFYVYQTISRSMVTSMGYLVQDLLLHSGPDVYDAKGMASDGGTKWDFVKKGLKKTVAWVEVKSGPNDMDKAQILYYKKMIEAVEKKKERGYIGETYGKRNDYTVTHGLYKTYLEDWSNRTLIGRELWEFVSNDKDYPVKLLELLKSSAEKVLLTKTILEEIDMCVSRVEKEFYTTYGKNKDSVSRYLDGLW